ncbi:hypothetical protein D3C85_985870 [compost metagenome]
MKCIGKPLGPRHDREDAGAYRRLRKANAELGAEGRGPGAAGHHHLAGLDYAFLGDDPRYPASLGLDTAGGAELVQRAAMFDHALGDQRCRPRRIGDAVGRRKHPAQPGLAGRRAALRGFGAAQHMGGDALGDREVAPFRPAVQLGLVIRQVEQAAAAETEVLVEVGGDLLPERETLGGQGQFARVAVLLAAPAPVAAGLLGAYTALLEHSNAHTLTGHVIGGAYADDAAADDDGIGAFWQLRCGRNGDQGSRHSILLA